MKTRLSVMLAALLSIHVFAQSEPNALGNFDHVVSQPAPTPTTLSHHSSVRCSPSFSSAKR